MTSKIFVVNNEPYCLWGLDLPERSREFLNGVDPGYFEFIHRLYVDASDEKRASVALRLALHHALETFYSFMGAYIQAPECAYAWIGKCSTQDLRGLLEKINSGAKDIFTELKLERVTWNAVATLIFSSYVPGTDRQTETIKRFSSLWSRMSRDFLDQTSIDEYNSLKHGFRVNSGGFTFAAGTEKQYGVAADDKDMTVLGHSDLGAKFFKISQLWPEKKSRSVRSVRTNVNWSIENISMSLQLIGMSINNVVSALKIANGFSAAECKFERPVEDSDFNKCWGKSVGMNSVTFDHVIDATNARPFSKDELVAAIARK